MQDLCDWVEYYAEFKTEWKDKNGDTWTTEERISRGGGTIERPEIPKGFNYLVELFFKLRHFTGSYENVIVPGLIRDLGESISADDCDMIYAMDRHYRKGMSAASTYWKDK